MCREPFYKRKILFRVRRTPNQGLKRMMNTEEVSETRGKWVRSENEWKSMTTVTLKQMVIVLAFKKSAIEIQSMNPPLILSINMSISHVITPNICMFWLSNKIVLMTIVNQNSILFHNFIEVWNRTLTHSSYMECSCFLKTGRNEFIVTQVPGSGMLLVEDSVCVNSICPTLEGVYIETQHLFIWGNKRFKGNNLCYGWIDSVQVLFS